MKKITKAMILLMWAFFTANLFSQTVYRIVNDGANGNVLDLDYYHAVQYGYYGGVGQHWMLEDGGDGTVIFRSAGYGTVLDLDGYHAVQYSYYGGVGQRWRIEEVGDGSVIIRSAGYGTVLDLDGYHAVQYEYYGGPCQHWRIIPVVLPEPQLVDLYLLRRRIEQNDNGTLRFGDARVYSTNQYAMGPQYTNDGVVCKIYTGQAPGTFPLYQFVTKTAPYVRHYTTSRTEWATTYNYEGVVGYVYLSPLTGTLPLYRYWRNNISVFNAGHSIGDRLYTLDPNNPAIQAQMYPHHNPIYNPAMSLEGVQCYVLPP